MRLATVTSISPIKVRLSGTTTEVSVALVADDVTVSVGDVVVVGVFENRVVIAANTRAPGTDPSALVTPTRFETNGTEVARVTEEGRFSGNKPPMSQYTPPGELDLDHADKGPDKYPINATTIHIVVASWLNRPTARNGVLITTMERAFFYQNHQRYVTNNGEEYIRYQASATTWGAWSPVGAPGFARWTLAANQSIPHATFTVVNGWDAYSRNRAGFTMRTDGVVEVDRPGAYTVTGQVNWASNSTGYRRLLIDFVSTIGATSTFAHHYTTASAQNELMQVVAHMWLEAGEGFRLRAAQASGAALDIASGSSTSLNVIRA